MSGWSWYVKDIEKSQLTTTSPIGVRNAKEISQEEEL